MNFYFYFIFIDLQKSNTIGFKDVEEEFERALLCLILIFPMRKKKKYTLEIASKMENSR